MIPRGSSVDRIGGRTRIRCVHIGDGRHSGAPNRLVTERNHCSSEAWMCWIRYTEIPPSTRRRLISAIASRCVFSGREIASPFGPT